MGKDAGSPPPAPDYKGQAIEQGKINQDTARLVNKLSHPAQVDAFGNSQTWKDLGNDQWSVNTTLGADQQAILDNLQTVSKGLGQTGQSLLLGVQNSLAQPLDTSGIPGRTFTLDPSQYKTISDFDPSANRDAVTDAMYRRATATLDPQWQKSETDLRTQLLNSGIREGSEAWNSEWDRLNRSKSGAYGDARDRAILAGGDEQSRLLAAQLGTQGFNNQTALTGAQFGNDQRAAGLNEATALRDMPLNDLMKLMQGASSGFQSPQFGNYQSANIAPTDVFGAGAMEGQDAQNRYNATVAEINSKNQQTGAVAGTALMAAAMFF